MCHPPKPKTCLHGNDDVSHLRNDEGGAVLVFGAFMMIIAVGMIWYVIGVGDSVLYKQKMQDGADAVAFQGAVVHAMGMNMLAFVNIIMAALLSVLVGLHVLEALLISMVAAGVALAIPTGGLSLQLSAIAGELESQVRQAIQVEERFLDVTLPALSLLEKGIATGIPVYAATKAGEFAKQLPDNSPVKAGGIVSESMVPLVPQDKYGLPVTEDTYANLCKRAGAQLGELIFLPFGEKLAKSVGQRFFSGLARRFAVYFCSENAAEMSNDELTQAASDSFSEGASQLTAEEQARIDAACANAENPEECRKSTANPPNIAKPNRPDGLHKNGGRKTPKKVHPLAENGNGMFQVWSVVHGDDRYSRMDKGVDTINFNQEPVKAPSAKISAAQAEYYCDVDKAWTAKQRGSVGNIAEDCMYMMHWRARLVRFHSIDRYMRPLNGNAGALVLATKALVPGVIALAGEKSAGDTAEWSEYITQGLVPVAATAAIDAMRQGNRVGVSPIQAQVQLSPEAGFVH